MSDDEGSCDTAILLENPQQNSNKIKDSTDFDSHSECSSVGKSRCSSPIVFIASIIAAVGGLLFGYDVGIVSGALLQLEREWLLTCPQKQLIVSSMLFGALGASCVGGYIIDKIGRKWTIILNSLIFIIGALVLAFSFNFTILIIGRIIVGFAVSLSAVSECIYISEIAPPNKRGFLVSLNELGITVGFLMAYMMNYFLADLRNGWRFMFGASVLPAFIQMFGMICLPSSPHYLMLKRRENEAQKVLSDLRGLSDVRQELTNIRITIDSEMDLRCFDLIRTQGMKYRFIIAIGLVLFQQFTGQPNVLYYASVIFESVGFCSEKDATFASLILGIIKLVSTGVSMLLLDKAGRRVFLILGALLMAGSISGLGLIACLHPGQFQLISCAEDMEFMSVPSSYTSEKLSFNDTLPYNITSFVSSEPPETVNGYEPLFFHSRFSQFSFNISHENGSSEVVDVNEKSCPKNLQDFSNINKWSSLTFLLIYVASYSIGFGPVTWLILSEIFPTSIKGRALALASVVNWGANIVVSSTFLDVMGLVSVGVTFLIYGLICLCSVLFIFLIVPETKNKPLHRLSKEIEQSNLGAKISHKFRGLLCCQYCKTQRYEQVSNYVNRNLAETTA